MRPMRIAIVLVMAVQVVVGQALPLSGSRPLNPVATAVESLLTRNGGEIASWCLGTLLLFSVVHRWSVCMAAAVYALYTAVVAHRAFTFDPFIGVLYVAYAILGVYIAATAWGTHDD